MTCWVVIVVIVQVLNAQFKQFPTELNHLCLEQKSQVIQRLKAQLSSATTPSVSDIHDVSNLSATFTLSAGSSLPIYLSVCLCLSTDFRHCKQLQQPDSHLRPGIAYLHMAYGQDVGVCNLFRSAL